MSAFISKKTKMLPMRYAQIYLWSTFLIFLSSNFVSEINNIVSLALFVFLAYLMFYLGYLFGVNTRKNGFQADSFARLHPQKLNLIIALGSLYFLVWGINQINDFGGGSPATVLTSILNPGASYKAKFEVYEYRLNTGAVNKITQVLIIFSFIYAVFIPVLVFYWRFVDRKLRLISVVSIVIYVVSFLYIGTQKGIGDVFLLGGAGVSILLGSGGLLIKRNARKKIMVIFIGFLGMAFFYMALNQSSRAMEFGISESMMFGDVSQTWLAQLFGEKMAFGVYSMLGYPSHGYAGLAYNLDQEFVFSYGAGFSQAFESYRLQYFGGNENFNLTYPARTELVTGWPAGMYWATAFPWFASDIGFAGVVILMFFVGFLFARTWLSCICRQDILSFAILGQLFVFIAFLPANNQVLMGRQGLWIVASILCIFIFRKLFRQQA